MKAIVAVDRNWGIGKGNELLVRLPGDLRYFKKNTIGKVLIMGRKTLESLPGGRALPGRTTIVMTSDEDYKAEAAGDGKVLIANSFDHLMTELLTLEFSEGIDIDKDVIVAGGESIYNMFVPYCSEFLVTKIDKEFEADKHFENIDRLAEDGYMKLTWESEPMEENGISYRFTKYER